MRSVFLNERQAREALSQLRARFRDDRITMKHIPAASPQDNEVLGDYDPLGGWRLSGTPLMTMPATGATLAGNSTTIDISLGELESILAMVSQEEAIAPRPRHSGRILADIEVHSAEEARAARDIMSTCGGYSL
mgnify:CR=1 FL=1